LRERPKSREETPKEGDGIERGLSRYRTATTYTASHKTQVLLTYFNCIFPHNLLHFCAEQVYRASERVSGYPKIQGKCPQDQLVNRADQGDCASA